MSNFNVQVNDMAVQSKLLELAKLSANLRPAFADIGEALKVQINGYFATEKGPDGQPWQANALSTTNSYVRARSGFSKKTGNITARGQAVKNSKKVLQGLTGELRRSIYWNATQLSLIIGSPKPYAAIHHYGGQFKAWGKTTLTMPTRPFMPVDSNDNLYPAAQTLIIKRLDQHLSQLK
jgi:phage virion morphogenesis protein